MTVSGREVSPVREKVKTRLVLPSSVTASPARARLMSDILALQLADALARHAVVAANAILDVHDVIALVEL